MNFTECINFSRGNPSGFNAGIKSKSNFNSIGFDRIIEKVLIQNESHNMLKNPGKNEIENNFKEVNEVITEQKQMCSKENVKSEASLEEIDSMLAMISILLNLSRQDLEGIREVLNNSLNDEARNEQIETSAIDEIHTFLKSNELLSKEDIDKAIDLLQTLDKTSITTKSSRDEFCFPEDGSKKIDLPEKIDIPKEDKDIHKLGTFDYPMKDSNKTDINKSESSKIDNPNNLIDNKWSSIEEGNMQKADSDYSKDSKSILDGQVKKQVSKEIFDIKVKAHNDINTEFITTSDIKFAAVDNSKVIQKNMESMESTRIINKEELFSQIIEKSIINKNEDFSEIRIQLKPDSLGKLTIRLIMEKGEMTAKFVAENKMVKETIESNFSELRDALSQKGLNIQNLSVSVGQQGKWQYENQNFRAWKNNIKRICKIENDDLDEEINILDYENPYSFNNGLVDIKV